MCDVLNSSGTYLSGLGKGTLQQYLLQLLGNRVTHLKVCDILKVLLSVSVAGVQGQYCFFRSDKLGLKCVVLARQQ